MNSDAASASRNKIPTRVKVSYGCLEWTSAFFAGLYMVYFLIFLTNVVGIRPSVAGIVMSIAVLWDAVTDPTVGILSDRTRSRYGRRRPYILASAVPYGLLIWACFTVPPLKESGLTVYYAVITLLLHTVFTLANVPYTALASEMTTDYDERTSLVTYRILLGNFGSLVAATLTPLLVDYLEKFGMPTKAAWSVVCAGYGFICIFPVLITWRGTRGWERYTEDTEALSFKDIFDALFGNRTFPFILAVFLFSISAQYWSGAITMYFLTDWMRLNPDQVSIYWLVIFVSMILWVPAITFVATRFGKRASFIFFMSMWAVTMAIGFMMIHPGEMVLLYALAILGSLGGVTSYQMNWAMIPDVVEVDEFKTGKRREGLYFGVCAFAMKAGAALSYFMMGLALDWIGYVPTEVQSDSTLMGIRVMTGPAVAVLTVIAIVFACFMPMTGKRHRALVAAIEAKKAGRPWDEEAIKELL
jgi:GPH family glycoside/pentoside/hexuronide:cation symporter